MFNGSLKDVITSIEEIIKEQQPDGQNHNVSPTQYFVVIVSVLGNISDLTHVVQLLEILEVVIPQASPHIVRSQFKTLSIQIMNICKQSIQLEKKMESKLLRVGLGALGSALCAQDVSDGFWGGKQALQSVNALLSFLDDSRYRLRRVVCSHLLKLLSIQKSSGGFTLRSYIAEFCTEVMNQCTRSHYRRSLFVVIFLESAAAYMPEPDKLCIIALKLQSSEQPVLTAAVFRMIDALFQSPDLSLSSGQLRDCLKILIQKRPMSVDMESQAYFYTSLASGLVKLHKLSHKMMVELLPIAISSYLIGCDTEFIQIHCAIGTALKRILSGCIDHYCSVTHSSDTANRSDELIVTIQSIVSSLLPVLQLRYQYSWVYVMDALKSLYEKLRGKEETYPLLDPMTVKISEIFEAATSNSITLTNDIITAIADILGIIIRSVGVAHFLSAVPIRTKQTASFAGIDFSKEWIITLLHNNLKHMHCYLKDFGNIILDIAKTCSTALKKASELSLKEYQVTLARKRILQMWALFPEFCSCGCLDVAEIFPKLSKIVSSAMTDVNYPELFPWVASGTSSIIQRAREKCPRSSAIESIEITVLKEHSSTFLPLLLTILESLDVSHQNFSVGVQCVSAWAQVAPPTLMTTLAKKLLQILLSTSTSTSSSTSGTPATESDSSSTASGWLSVMLAVIPYIPDNMVQLLYRTVRPLLSIQESISLQKRAYTVLEYLLLKRSSVISSIEQPLSLLSVINESLLVSHVSARNMRLRCILALLTSLEGNELIETSKMILGEILICQKDANKKSRECSVVVLKEIIKKISPDVLLPQIFSAIVAETTLMRSSAVIGLCLMLIERRSDEWLIDQAAKMLPTIVLLLHEECTEQSRAVLAFLRVVVAILPVDVLSTVVSVILDAALNKLGHHKSKFASRVRGIVRKLSQRISVEDIRPWIPESDMALVDYIQRQARRSRRRKENKEEGRLRQLIGSDVEDGDESTDDEQGDEDEIDTRLSSRPRATRVSEMRDSSSVPMSLDDLLEDQPAAILQRSFLQNPKPRMSAKETEIGFDNMKPGAKESGDDSDDEYEVKIDASGRVVVSDKKKESAGNTMQSSAMDLDVSKSSNKHQEAIKTDQGNERKRKMKEPGEEYRSSKAGGDVWRRGMLEPHAYIPLDGRLLSRKNHRQAIEQFSVVVKNGKKKRVEVRRGRKGKPIVSGKRNQRSKASKMSEE